MKAQRFVPVLVIAAGVWAYHNSFEGAFIFDDVPSIPDNPHIRHLWSIHDALCVSPSLPVQGRPVECWTLALNYALGGLNVWGYHAFNLALHLLSALVLFGILWRTFAGEKLRDRYGASATWLAAAITLVWEVHPLQTESVSYIVQRSELMMGLFLLLTLYCTLRGSQSPRPRGWYWGAIVSCALGMGSKEVMVCAPLIVLIYDRVFLATSFRQLWDRRASLYVGLAGTWLILAVLVARTVHPMTRFGIEDLTAWDYLKTEAGVIVHYLRLCFWPHPLVVDYSDWPIALSVEDVLVSGTAMLGLLGATALAFRWQPCLGFLGAWFFLILGPTSSFLPSVGEVAAERRMYLPLASVVTLAVVGAFEIGKRLFNRPKAVVLGCVVGGSVVVLFTFLTIHRNRDYNSELTIWQDTVDRRPGDERAHNNLGLALQPAGRIEEAIAHFEQALQLNPDDSEVHNNLGSTLMESGRMPEAIDHLEQAVRIQPGFAEAHYNLGMALARTGKIAEAIPHYGQAVRIKPDLAEAHYNLGMALAQTGKIEEAITQFQQTLRLKPDLAETHYKLALALAQAGRMEEAIARFEQALRLKPDLAEGHCALGMALEQAGRIPEAIEHYQQALRIKPDFTQARNALAQLQARQ